MKNKGVFRGRQAKEASNWDVSQVKVAEISLAQVQAQPHRQKGQMKTGPRSKSKQKAAPANKPQVKSTMIQLKVKDRVPAESPYTDVAKVTAKVVLPSGNRSSSRNRLLNRMSPSLSQSFINSSITSNASHVNTQRPGGKKDQAVRKQLK